MQRLFAMTLLMLALGVQGITASFASALPHCTASMSDSQANEGDDACCGHDSFAAACCLDASVAMASTPASPSLSVLHRGAFIVRCSHAPVPATRGDAPLIRPPILRS